MRVRSISITAPIAGAIPGLQEDSPEALIVYCARVSSPANQDKHDTGERLLRYCIRHGHWSVFEMSDWTVEIETSRAIAAQILRHRSFSFQEFSQRYSPVTALRQGPQAIAMRPANPGGNRQGSDEVEPLRHPNVVQTLVTNHLASCDALYTRLLEEGVAPECARMILPLATTTRLYAKGSVRSWIHYIQTRCSPHTQKEHREIALEIRDLFAHHFPIIHSAAFSDHA